MKWVDDSPTNTQMASDPTAVQDPTDGPLIYFRGTAGTLRQTHYVSGPGWVTDPNPLHEHRDDQ